MCAACGSEQGGGAAVDRVMPSKNQIVWSHRFRLYHKQPNSGERQENQGPGKGDLVPRQSLRRGRQKSISPQESGFQQWRAPILTILN